MILVDTHVLVWLADAPEMLSLPAKDAILRARADGGVGIADVTLWELALLVSLGRVNVRTSLESFLRTVEAGFVVFPISGAIARRATEFSDQYPRDPMDRLIGATAIVEQLSLVTRDEGIRASGEVPFVW